MRGFYWLSQLIVKLFVRSDVQGSDYLAPCPNTLYVLETSRYSHRFLVIEQLRKAGNTLPEQKMLSAAHDQQESLRGRLESQVERLEFLADDEDIHIIPVSIYHGRMPQRETSLLNLLYAETWDKAGIIGRMMQLLINGRQTLIQIDPPLSLKQLKQESPHQPAGVVAHKAARVFHAHFHRRRQAIIGPDLSHRRTLIKLILNAPEVKQAIQAEASRTSHSLASIEQLAAQNLEGIAANFSPTTARLLAPLLGFFWRKVYKKMHIAGIEKVQACAPDHQLVYLPCHRSHMDYVMLSWSLYQHGLMIPHIAAGDNLNAPILGSILKRGGAIFMRRRFNNDQLYTQLFKSYLSYMASRGHSLEYFIEGGRSRTGRLLPAKTGLLSMTLEDHLRKRGKPVALVPIWISYDKLVESKSYRQELQGEQKQGESFWGLLKTLKMFNTRFGDASLSFGEPILLQDAYRKTQDLKTNTHFIGNEVLSRINKATWVNETALIATILLASPKRAFSIESMVEQLTLLSVLLKRLPNAPAGIAKGDPSDWLYNAAQRKQLSLEDGEVFLYEDQAQEMAFYRNQLHHLTLLPGLYLLLASRYPKPMPHTLPRLLTPLYPYLKAELCLPWCSEELSPALKKIRINLEKRGLLIRQTKYLEVSDQSLAYVLMQTAEPVLLRYYLVFRLLATGHQLTKQGVIEESQRIAASLHRQFGFHSPEYSDKNVLNVFVDTLLEQHVLAEASQRLISLINNDALLKRAHQILNPQHTAWIEHALTPR